MARMTLWGMYQYEPKLFEGALLPPRLSKDIFIDFLMHRCGQLYPYHQQPHMLRIDISIWFQGHLEDFTRIRDALEAQYNPIENYDRHEWSKRDYDNSGTDTVTDSGTDKIIDGGSDHTHDEGDVTTTPNITNTTNVSAFDSDGYEPREQNSQTGNSKTVSEGDNTITYGRTQDTNYGKSQATQHGHQIDDEYRSHTHGNIGVTTNQQMITQELELRTTQNVYDIICRLFEKEFIVQVY